MIPLKPVKMKKKSGNNLPGKKKTGGNFTSSHAVRWVLAFSFIVALSVLYRPQMFQVDTYNYKAGELCREEIRAPRTITLQKDDETWAEEEKAAESRVPVYLNYRGDVVSSHMEYLDTFFAYIDSISSVIQTLPDTVMTPEYNFSRWNFGISDEDLGIFFESADTRRRLEEFIKRTVNDFYEAGIIEDSNELVKTGNRKMVLIQDGEEAPVTLFQFYRASTYLNKIVKRVEQELGKESDAVRVAEHIIARILTPNIFVDNERIRQEAAGEISKLSRDWVTYLADEKIIGAYEQVTVEQAKVLNALRNELVSEQAFTSSGLGVLSGFIAKVAFLCVILVLFSWYLIRFKPEIFEDNSSLLLLLILILLPAYVSAYILYSQNLNNYLVPVSLAVILCALLVDNQLAVVLSIFISLIITSFTSFDPSLLLVCLIVTLTASLSFRPSGNRLVYFRMASYISAAYIISIVFTGVIAQVDWILSVKRIGFGVGSGFASTFIAISILPIFERGFKITTDLTLYELADFNRPLLRRLSLEAPGTYHHSVVVGNLGEAAATAIGADPLLTRVGAYYHDIGKLNRPEYFIENQFSRDNKHDALNPAMSNLVIVSHTKEGVKLGRKEGLPEVIIDFIKEHHGTTIQRYFYNKALETESHDIVRAEDYRYPGPKPRSKETAIVMLADTVEAMTYTLRDATQGKIRGLIKKAFDSKLGDEQLSDCDLTFNDLAKIRESFIPVLKGILQKRIDYPSSRTEQKKHAAGEGEGSEIADFEDRGVDAVTG